MINIVLVVIQVTPIPTATSRTVRSYSDLPDGLILSINEYAFVNRRFLTFPFVSLDPATRRPFADHPSHHFGQDRRVYFWIFFVSQKQYWFWVSGYKPSSCVLDRRDLHSLRLSIAALVALSNFLVLEWLSWCIRPLIFKEISLNFRISVPVHDSKEPKQCHSIFGFLHPFAIQKQRRNATLSGHSKEVTQFLNFCVDSSWHISFQWAVNRAIVHLFRSRISTAVEGLWSRKLCTIVKAAEDQATLRCWFIKLSGTNSLSTGVSLSTTHVRQKLEMVLGSNAASGAFLEFPQTIRHMTKAQFVRSWTGSLEAWESMTFGACKQKLSGVWTRTFLGVGKFMSWNCALILCGGVPFMELTGSMTDASSASWGIPSKSTPRDQFVAPFREPAHSNSDTQRHSFESEARVICHEKIRKRPVAEIQSQIHRYSRIHCAITGKQMCCREGKSSRWSPPSTCSSAESLLTDGAKRVIAQTQN
jgi:hypothetical protein